MNDDVVVGIEGVSKKYCKSLKHSMAYGIMDIGRNMLGLSSRSERLRPGEFWALDSVSFEVKRGESLGLIGPNGSGKTTLLKMINGIFWPDKGKIFAKGRVGALIAVGAGFHPLLTGRENIYLNGAILGMRKEEVKRKFDSIVDFADVGDFLDSPIKHYSSGMFVKLGFAVAIHCELDILLVDEVLAVGDVAFQKKCLTKMKDLLKKGTSVIVVSHSAPMILTFCESALLLYKGRKYGHGDAVSVMRDYVNLMETIKADRLQEEAFGEAEKSKIHVKDITFWDVNGNKFENNEIPFGRSFVARVSYTSPIRVPKPLIWANIYKENDLVTILGGLFCEKYVLPSEDLPSTGTMRITVKEQNFAPGVYVFRLGMRSDVDVSEEFINNDAYFRVMDDGRIRGIPFDNRSLVIMKNEFELHD